MHIVQIFLWVTYIFSSSFSFLLYYFVSFIQAFCLKHFVFCFVLSKFLSLSVNLFGYFSFLLRVPFLFDEEFCDTGQFI